MKVYETFARRHRKLRQLDRRGVFQEAALPQQFRIQIIPIWRSAVGSSHDFWDIVHQTLTREFGLPHLGYAGHSRAQQCEEFILAGDTDQVLAALELTFRLIDRVVRKFSYFRRVETGITRDADDVIDELNERFMQHGIGYRYANGKLVPTGFHFLDIEAVKPAIALLGDALFFQACQEFQCAHDLHRQSKNSQAVAQASKAFASTMRSICRSQQWLATEEQDAASLIGVLVEHNLIPMNMVSYFSTLCSILDTRLPPTGAVPVHSGDQDDGMIIPDHFASYALHLTASNIIFLIEAYQALHGGKKTLDATNPVEMLQKRTSRLALSRLRRKETSQ